MEHILIEFLFRCVSNLAKRRGGVFHFYKANFTAVYGKRTPTHPPSILPHCSTYFIYFVGGGLSLLGKGMLFNVSRKKTHDIVKKSVACPASIFLQQRTQLYLAKVSLTFLHQSYLSTKMEDIQGRIQNMMIIFSRITLQGSRCYV